ncbi:hypothetical protein ACWDYJ_35730 [Streptomyces sp. NPDC003042]
MAATNTFLMVADSKLVPYSNITALLQAGVEFIAPVQGSADQV